MTNWDPGRLPCCRRAARRGLQCPTPAECLACLGPLTPCPPPPGSQPHQGGIQVSLGAGQPARPPSRPHLCSPGPSLPPPGSVVDGPQVTTFLTCAFSLHAERDSIVTVCLLSGVVTCRLRKRPGLRRGTALCSQPACKQWSRGGGGVFPGQGLKGGGGFLEPISPFSFAAKHWFIGGPTHRSFPLAKETLGSVFCV